jgi:hypothetical protein
MLSEATGTTPSLQDNKGRRDAIIPHQFLTACRETRAHGQPPLWRALQPVARESRDADEFETKTQDKLAVAG